METIFTLPYTEFAVASALQEAFPATEGYSLYMPVSRQQKAVDLALIRRKQDVTRCLTLQVKASRPYHVKGKAEAQGERLTYCGWFNTFKVDPMADFYFFVCVFPVEARKAIKTSTTWEPLILCFSRAEADDLLTNVKMKKGKAETKFEFGYNDDSKVFLLRGATPGEPPDLSQHLLRHKVSALITRFEAP